MGEGTKVKLKYTACVSGEYWDEAGPHTVLPGQVVEFSADMAAIRMKENCWKKQAASATPGGAKPAPKEEKKGGEK